MLNLAAALIVETDWARHTGAVPSPAAPPRADLWTYSYPPIACGLALATCAIAIVLNMGHEHHGRSPTRREDEAEGEDEAELQAALALSMVEGLPHAPERK